MKTGTTSLVVRPTRLVFIINKIAKLLGLPGIDYTLLERRRDMPTDRGYVEVTLDKNDKEEDDAKNNMP